MKMELSEEQIDKMVNEIIKQMEEKDKVKEIFRLEKQDSVMENIYLFLKEAKFIDNEDISYFPEKYSFTGEHFYFVFDNLYNYAREKYLTSQDKDIFFPHYNFYVTYKDLNINGSIMWGQGTSMQLSVSSKKHWKKSKSFNYEDYKKLVTE